MISLDSSIPRSQNTCFSTSNLWLGCISKIFSASWRRKIVLSKTSWGGSKLVSCCCKSVSFLKTISSGIMWWALSSSSISRFFWISALVWSISRSCISVHSQEKSCELVESFDFPCLRRLIMRYTCPSVLKRSFTVPVFDWILRIFLQEDL